MGLAPMNESEKQEVEGGSWYTVGALAFGIAAVICTGGMAPAAGGAALACTALDN